MIWGLDPHTPHKNALIALKIRLNGMFRVSFATAVAENWVKKVSRSKKWGQEPTGDAMSDSEWGGGYPPKNQNKNQNKKVERGRVLD